MRRFLESFAESRNMDPLLAETWYEVPLDEIRRIKGGNTVLAKLKGGYFQVLQDLFPEIRFDANKFRRYSWRNIRNRRRFFEKYAKEKGFDPQNPANWYSQSRENIQSSKGASSVLFYHKHNVITALLDLFPDIGLDKTKFQHVWQDIGNRRKFFVNYAKNNGFDPLNPGNWYSRCRAILNSSKEVHKVLVYYNYSVPKALLDLFPDIGLDKEKFREQAQNFWRESDNRRQFFVSYANKKRFDPLKPQNWYSQSKEDIMSVKGANRVLSYHNHSVVEALLDLFPEIALDKQKIQAQYVWHGIENRRKLFETYAEKNGFDPQDPENWYIQSKENILSTEGAINVLLYYNNSVAEALLDLFPNIGLEKQKFKTPSMWHEIGNRRIFFENYAKENGFDHLNPGSWYLQTNRSITSIKGASKVLFYHNYSVPKALLDLFPNIGLDKAKLQMQYFWSEFEQRRNFFEKYAKNKGFDPENPEGWYFQSRESITSTKGASGILSYYNNSISRALLDLFPNIGLDKTKFQMQVQVKNMSREMRIRRKFFENFAKANGFDPQDPERWCSQSAESVSSTQGASRILASYNFNVSRALLDLFPNIGLDKTKLRR